MRAMVARGVLILELETRLPNVQVLGPLLCNCVTLGRLFKLSILSLFICKMGIRTLSTS